MKDEWLREAMTDDGVVVEVLLLLKQSGSHPPRPPKRPSAFPPLDWGLRQPRSKVASSKKEREPTRLSPTTPLSWSLVAGGSGCGASPSDGYEESSRPSYRFLAFRSKGTGTTNTIQTSNKRPKRKKTFVELKEEESSLLKERSYLRMELATLREALKEQISTNENLKRMKISFHEELETKSGLTLNKTDEENATNPTEASTLECTPSSVPKHVSCDDASGSELCPSDIDASTLEHPAFALPDLNMMPEEDPVLETQSDETDPGFSDAVDT
ncbi:hypothetical protein Nepgr_012707 [Nepenthes gracilis]|uniref:Uncharacterized protein n=1 Tax=Nepenthes gracilis TaxID=150966 RepID=A0AAD3SHL0_NEPGR|nr:hypothetical protein Nepgr_012707 [Nepenthes gracilis]